MGRGNVGPKRTMKRGILSMNIEHNQKTEGERLGSLRELKVKLPVQLLVNLHYLRLTRSTSIGHVVNAALTKYFEAEGLAPKGPRPTLAVAPSA